MNRIGLLLGTAAAAMAAGAGMMFTLDPDRGRRRRARIRGRGAHAMHKLRGRAAGGSRDLFNRTRGVIAGARFRLSGGDRVEDAVLEARVRSSLGHCIRHPGAIEVKAERGTVALRGPVPAHEGGQLLQRVARVPGVKDVRNELLGYRGGPERMRAGRSQELERTEGHE